MEYKIDSFQTKHIWLIEKIVGFLESKQIISAPMQREIDIERVDEIIKTQKDFFHQHKTFLFLGDIILSRINNVLFVVDGNHRIHSMKQLYMLKPDYPVMVSVFEKVPMELLFQLVNKSVPVPDYVKNTIHEQSKKMCLDVFGKLFHKEFGPFLSKSLRPHRPNIYLPHLQDALYASELVSIFKDGGELFEYIKFCNDSLKSRNDKISDLANAKAQKNNSLPLFLTSDVDNTWMYDKFILCNFKKQATDSRENNDQGKKSETTNIPEAVREKVWRLAHLEAFQGICHCCKKTVSKNAFECGHMVSKANGGSTMISNLKVLCFTCNRSMGKQNLLDFCTRFGFDL